MTKKALITGITGQDGSYLAELLLEKNYIVHGIRRRSSSINTSRIDHLHNNKKILGKRLFLHYGDLLDSLSIEKIIKNILPDEIYNLAAQSHVKISFDMPEYTSNVNSLGTLRILEIIKNLSKKKKIKFYQAGTSEMFGASKPPQSEKTPFYPRSPYAAAKLYAHWITINYREAYKIFAANGILFNHESPLRGETFVTKKVVKALCNIKLKKQKKLFIGNLYAKRDWGHASDYVQAIWKIMQHKKPDDFIICTGKQYTIKQFINMVLKELKMTVKWSGKGINEKAFDTNNICIIECSKKYFRPTEVDTLKGDYSKAKKELKWEPKHDIRSLIKDMINYEMHILKND